jgi:uncharacterized membrane protein YraQ (UPF0718 family)
MTTEILKITEFMINAFIHIWPYLVITIPIAVAVNMSGASKHIKRAFDAGPVAAIFLATLVGAFSPFCSCGVIPVIAALLIGGVPLPPVMAFWIASPSMDPEIFFLSVGTIGWDLAVWRLAGTLALSLAAGFITHLLVVNQWIPTDILKHKTGPEVKNGPGRIQRAVQRLRTGVSMRVKRGKNFIKPKPMVQATACCTGNPSAVILPSVNQEMSAEPVTGGSGTCGCDDEKGFRQRLFRESLDATLLVIKFMALAFFLEALIILYVPQEWITTIMGRENSWAILTAAFLGIPVYTSNLSALPMVSGLLAQGMSPAAALAFLIAGPTTTLPAMAAVWTLVRYRVFLLYVSFSLFGAIGLGYLRLLF